MASFLAAMMSSLAAVFTAASTVFTFDVYHRLVMHHADHPVRRARLPRFAEPSFAGNDSGAVEMRARFATGGSPTPSGVSSPSASLREESFVQRPDRASTFQGAEKGEERKSGALRGGIAQWEALEGTSSCQGRATGVIDAGGLVEGRTEAETRSGAEWVASGSLPLPPGGAGMREEGLAPADKEEPRRHALESSVGEGRDGEREGLVERAGRGEPAVDLERVGKEASMGPEERRVEERRLVAVGRWTTVAMVVMSLLWLPVIRGQHGQLYLIAQSGTLHLAPPVVAVFVLGVAWRRATKEGALAGLGVGAVAGVVQLALSMARHDYCDSLVAPRAGEADRSPRYTTAPQCGLAGRGPDGRETYQRSLDALTTAQRALPRLGFALACFPLLTVYAHRVSWKKCVYMMMNVSLDLIQVVEGS